MILVQEGESEPTFSDVPADAYYFNAVEWAVEKGITAGVSETSFGSYQSTTRAQVVTFLWANAGKPEIEAASSFDDIVAGAWYESAINWAAASGVTSGKNANIFGVNDICTRAQGVTFLYKVFGA